MSLQDLQAFIAHVQTVADPELKRSLEAAAAGQNLVAMATIAQQAGFAVEADDLQEFHAQQIAKLDDEALVQASGGKELKKLSAEDDNIWIFQQPLDSSTKAVASASMEDG